MTDRLNKKAYAMKLKMLELARNAYPKGVHLGGALSSTEIMAVLTDILNLDGSSDRDRIILSKAHSALSLYTALWQKGIFPESFLDTYDKDRSGLFSHPSRNIDYGIEFSGGSLGLGISYAVGQAIALKLKGSAALVHCIVGDGELDEGIVWEAFMSAANFKLSNLTVTIDSNKGQLDGPVEDVMSLGDIKAKMESFGFAVTEIDGHDIQQLIDAYGTPHDEKPLAVIANTVKGHGVDFLTGSKESHFCMLSGKKYGKAVEQIKQSYGYGD